MTPLGVFPLTQLERVMTDVLEWLHTSVGFTWAWSIVALTVLVRVAILPLTIMQVHSMQNLQAHAPEMKEIQQRWKHDKQRQNEELQKFYRENKINPAASCLPMVAQIPIFISLFFVLRDFEKEIWDPQYSPPETLADLSWLGLVNIHEPVIDAWGPLLLVVYVASQLSSTLLMSTTMPKAQRILILALPFVFIPFILNFPSGLMIYWLTTNLWSTGQGIVTRKLIPKPPTPDKRTSRAPAKEQPAPAPSRASRGGTKRPAAPPAGDRPAVTSPPRRVKRKRKGSGPRR